MRTLLEAEPLAPVSETLSQAADQLRSSNTTILLLAAPSLQGALAIAPLEAALVDAGHNLLSPSVTHSVTFTVEEAPAPNQPPSFSGGSTFTTLENNASSFFVSATDPDGDVLTYTKTGADADKFTLNVNTGELTFNAAPDYEANASAAGNNAYAVTVTVTDGEANATQAVSINVTRSTHVAQAAANLEMLWCKPGTFMMVDQFIDRTFSRNKTFFGDGLVAHVSMAQPVCGRMVGSLADVSDESSIEFCRGGTYLVMEGPQFSTLAESELYRSWGADVIGMTNMPEAKLAREAELCYATVAMVTDYDCWHPDHGNVSVRAIMRVLEENLENAHTLIRGVAKKLAAHSGPCIDRCDRSLEHAVATTPEAQKAEAIGRLSVVAGRVLATSTE